MSSRVKINENKIFRHWQDPRWTIGNKPNSYSGCMLAGDIGGGVSSMSQSQGYCPRNL